MWCRRLCTDIFFEELLTGVGRGAIFGLHWSLAGGWSRRLGFGRFSRLYRLVSFNARILHWVRAFSLLIVVKGSATLARLSLVHAAPVTNLFHCHWRPPERP